MLVAYTRVEDLDESRYICDKFYILDTDDFIIESISHDKLKSLIKSGRVEIHNIEYDEYSDRLYFVGELTLLDVFRNFSSPDNVISIVKCEDDVYNNLKLVISGKRVYIEYIEIDATKRYKIRINGVDLAYFCPSDLSSNCNTMNDINEDCFMGFGILYWVNSDILAVKYIVRLWEGEETEASILLFFDKAGDFIDSYEYDERFFKRIKTRKVSRLVAKLVTLKKGIL